MKTGFISSWVTLEVILQSSEAERYCAMEGYNKVKNDACDTYKDATDGIAKEQELEKPHHNM